MKKFLTHIRYPNLLIIAFVMYAMRYGVVYPFLKYNNFDIQLNGLLFFGLVFSVILIAAGGYLINDFEDLKIDAKNNPEKYPEGESPCAQKMYKAYNYFTVFGITIGGIVSYYSENFIFITIFVLAAGLLWFYSSTYKMMPFFGNLVVAFLTGIVPLLVVLFEIPLLTEKYRDILVQNNVDFMPLFYFVLAFGIFAFLTTVVREVIKDIEDVEGDKTYKKNTIPVALGVTFAKIVAVIFIIITIATLFYTQIVFDLGETSFWYITIALVLPLAYIAVKTFLDKTPENFHLTSTFLKIIMILGISYSIVLYYSFTM